MEMYCLNVIDGGWLNAYCLAISTHGLAENMSWRLMLEPGGVFAGYSPETQDIKILATKDRRCAPIFHKLFRPLLDWLSYIVLVAVRICESNLCERLSYAQGFDAAATEKSACATLIWFSKCLCGVGTFAVTLK